jgi:hypothetical protein
MADAPAATGKGKGLDLSALTKKVGPLPLWAWIAAAVVIVWYFERQNKAAAASAAGSTGMVTDPAGNQCASGDIDNLTGYCTGTSEDLAAIAQQQQASSGSSTTGSSSGSTSGAQTFADNNAWGIAAIAYLESTGIPATAANQAIQDFLASNPLTSQEQNYVNLAIAAIGPPPVLPGPIVSTSPTGTGSTSPPGGSGTGSGSGGGGSGSGSGTGTGTGSGSTQVAVPNVVGKSQESAFTAIASAGLKASGSTVIPGKTLTVDSESPKAGTKVTAGSTVKLVSTVHSGSAGGAPAPAKKTTAPVPTGLTVSAKHSTSLQVKWNASKGATGYHVLCTDMATKKVTNQFDVSASQTDANCGGLTPSHSYVIDVWAEPEAGGVGTGAHAEVSVTLPKTG